MARKRRSDSDIEFDIKLASLLSGYWIGVLLAGLAEAHKRDRERVAALAYTAGYQDSALIAAAAAKEG